MSAPRIILASQSRARQKLLEAAGVEFRAEPAAVDEEAIREALNKDQAMPTEDVALILAQAKAAFVAGKYPHDYVIGADQMLEFDGHTINKAATLAQARAILIQLRGRTHRLISAVSVVHDGTTVWRHTEEATLEMRNFSNEFLGQYMAAMGNAVMRSVGGYQIEGLGIQLFAKVTGDIFTIQGLPLLPLLAFLRRQQVIA